MSPAIKAFYSDPHFGHWTSEERNIIKYCDRPFESTEQMDDILIGNYNQLIGPDDVVLWLGDCFFGPADYAENIMCLLHGHKILVPGGHDGSPNRMLRIGFDLVVLSDCFIRIAGRLCRCSHYPYRGTPHRKGKKVESYALCEAHRRGELLIHGHTHVPSKGYNNMIHVGVDAWDYKPAMMEEVEAIVKERNAQI
jgi:calcineurin-like phosphoesterase family protein